MKISIEEWNAKYPPGTKVRIAEQRIVTPAREFVTAGKAFVRDCIPMVDVDDGSRWVSLDFIDSISDDASDA